MVQPNAAQSENDAAHARRKTGASGTGLQNFLGVFVHAYHESSLLYELDIKTEQIVRGNDEQFSALSAAANSLLSFFVLLAALMQCRNLYHAIMSDF